MKLSIPALSVVALIGPSGAGKSTFARRHFLATEILSSDTCRALVSDDENDQSATGDAFELLHFLAAQRLRRGRLVVVDATNVQKEARQALLSLAQAHDVHAIALVFDLPEKLCQERNAQRSDRNFGPHVVRRQREHLRRSLRHLRSEGFRQVHVLESPAEIDQVVIERVPLWTDRRHDSGPFDIFGDVHGCCDELEELLAALGYVVTRLPESGPCYAHPAGRKAIFLGDLVDRGPRVLDTVELVRQMVAHGSALCVPGNHDVKLVRKLRGKEVRVAHGLAQTLAEIEATPPETRAELSARIAAFLDGLVSHYVLDGGRLVVAHAGLKEEFQGRASGRVRAFCLYGETTGETDEFGLPVRYDWATDYRGRAAVVYGHTPTPASEWLNGTICLDTGCVFGGRLTALRWPEKELVSVPARRVYCEPVRPLVPVPQTAPPATAQQRADEILDREDVTGKRRITTRWIPTVTVGEENSAAALEVMSRFAADPRWLLYLPPTMSPCDTSRLSGWLEHPAEAFSYFRGVGIHRLVCEEKHMGSRAVVIVGRDETVLQRRLGIAGDGTGIVYTRTGRRFFADRKLEEQLLEHLRQTLTAAGLWQALETDWLCFDCELMPWSAKAQELLQNQYAAVGAAGRASLEAGLQVLRLARQRAPGDAALEALAERWQQRSECVALYREAYGRYCWPIDSLDGLRLAPFHILAGESRTFVDRDHRWHLETLARWVAADSRQLLWPTRACFVDLTAPESEQAGIDWWLELTAGGGEGMVVKPLEFLVRGSKGLVQPAVKCRGREYLRIIYGPEYDLPANLERLRSRHLRRKRDLALREFVLGLEGLERFVQKEPLRRVHECAFAVLALESEPIDPRL